MSTFDKRADAFEGSFAMGSELAFKATARRDKLLGQWAAEKLGLAGDIAEDYANKIVQTDLKEPGDEDIFARISKDFADASVEQSEHQIRRTMEELMAVAKKEVAEEA
ncbi:DUF1476 domain-containing protein [Pseudovibrio ascidiaceicola]|jgi:hypothetical protein|uniref:DUF1476 domain-containing protein n=1 Tax=Pseudovibrio ascidiaceicola TaxID=285279 RepID=A0A1I4CET3_9HYPH|nr:MULTISPECIES: DUF1476 domain-containing protein [Pseudovibrio]KZK81333.1 hypothetical protein PsAD13_04284 [Pseudovibrio sp. Ad13]KZK93133.1 hypothetical protein PsW74_05288 [Pseudovibrio sp. W74]KZL07024.1 hypothetical protein PsAD14_04491 [Pseudovibrio sp. Ad14]KZL23071.1 hypothetical protein PsWM33_03256 [Pseudovibrio sp. WM33]SFK79694.1 hypothetical protein SAMN04488518_109117 [Pseudovibrio ascidiaceicola]